MCNVLSAIQCYETFDSKKLLLTLSLAKLSQNTKEILKPLHLWKNALLQIYSVILKDGLSFVRLYFLNYTRYVNDLHNI